MPDLNRLRSELCTRHDESWVRHHLESFPALYFETFDADDVSRHLEVSTALSDAVPVAVRVTAEEGGGWWVEIVGYDAFQFLSTLCSLLALRDLSIIEGRVFTSLPPPAEDPAPRARGRRPGLAGLPRRSSAGPGPDRRKRIVDRFRVRLIEGAASEPDWPHFEAELNELTRWLRAGRFEDVNHRLIGRFVAALGRHRPESETLEPLGLEVDPVVVESATVVRISARDHFGFLSLTASALALCGIRIVQADIRTQKGRAEDTLWVTDRGGKKIVAEAPLRELRLSLILIEHFSSYLPHATNPESALVHFSRFATETMARQDWAEEFAALDRPEVLDALVRVLGESDFLWEDYLHAQPEHLLPMICDPSQWRRRRTAEELARELDDELAPAGMLAERSQVLHRFQARETFRTGIRAILGLSGGPERFSAELSDVAEVLLSAAYRIAEEEVAPTISGHAKDRPLPAVLCALGKCGGRELGFGSDLELMFVYDDRRVDPGSGKEFDRAVAVIKGLLAVRRGGTFDVDFRLRPYGRSGTPSTSLSGFAGYYRDGGPAWSYERQALVKLRAIAGDLDLGREVESLRDQYVYGPAPFDMEGCRRMRRLQVEQLVERGTLNAKYSPGGLVEAEYFVQALQIAHGGRIAALRTPSTLRALESLAATGILSAEEAARLRAGYECLRALIDALRVVRGHPKDLTIPRPDSEEFLLLARRMKRREPTELNQALHDVLGFVSALSVSLEHRLGS